MSVYCPALMYHRVVARGETPDEISVTEDAFAQHLDWLREWGCESVSAADLAAALEGEGSLPERPVIVTFDDGFEDNASRALPLLRERGFTALVFVVAGFMGRRRTFGRGKGEALLTHEQIGEMAQAGIEFGSHTLTHPQLIELPEQEARRELAESKSLVEQAAGREVSAFCYPFGELGLREMDLAREAGYRCAFTIWRGNRHHPAERFCLSRVWTNQALTRGRLAYRLGWLYDWTGRLRNPARR